MRSLERNVPLAIAIELAADPAKLSVVRQMKWWTRKFDAGKVLLGDRPLISAPMAKWPCGIAIDDPNCIIALPISSDTVFFASANPKTRTKMTQMNPGKVLQTVNEETIYRGVEYVFTLDNSMAAFVTDRISGKMDGSWRPLP
jgi:hypothetical protein